MLNDEHILQFNNILKNCSSFNIQSSLLVQKPYIISIPINCEYIQLLSKGELLPAQMNIRNRSGRLLNPAESGSRKQNLIKIGRGSLVAKMETKRHKQMYSRRSIKGRI